MSKQTIKRSKSSEERVYTVQTDETDYYLSPELPDRSIFWKHDQKVADRNYNVDFQTAKWSKSTD